MKLLWLVPYLVPRELETLDAVCAAAGVPGCAALSLSSSSCFSATLISTLFSLPRHLVYSFNRVSFNRVSSGGGVYPFAFGFFRLVLSIRLGFF